MTGRSSSRARQAVPAPTRSLPTQVAKWAKAWLGTVAPWPLPVDLSGAHTWRFSAPQGLVDIRVTRTDLDFRREVHAYRTAIRRLVPAHGPRLIACEPRLRVLLTTHPRGRLVDDEAGLHMLPRIHQDAGHLLALLHGSVSQVRDARGQAARHLTQHTQRIVRLLDYSQGWLSSEETECVRRSAARLLGQGEELPVAFCHGTFGSSCWRWNVAGQSLSLIGLGRAQIMPAVLDFARVAPAWSEHPHLAEAFFGAYGRTLTTAEQVVIEDAALLAAAEDLYQALMVHDSDALTTAGAALRQAVCRQPPDRERTREARREPEPATNQAPTGKIRP